VGHVEGIELKQNQEFSPAKYNTFTVGCNTQKGIGGYPKYIQVLAFPTEGWSLWISISPSPSHCGYGAIVSSINPMQQQTLLITKELPLISQMHWTTDRHTQKQPSHTLKKKD